MRLFNIMLIYLLSALLLQAGESPANTYLTFTVEFEMAEPAEFKARDMRFSDLPLGAPCAFMYTGPTKPATHKFFHDMGFKATMFVGADTKAETLKALEAAGVDIALGSYKGGKVTYSSFIGGNTVQEAFDVVAAARMELQKKVEGPVHVASISGHIRANSWILHREPYALKSIGYGAVMSDANVRMNYMTIPSSLGVLLGHEGHEQTSLEYYSQLSSMDTRKIPNEMIYYQILANAFEGATKRVGNGAIVRVQLRDFDQKDLLDIKDQIEKYGKHPKIWQANMSMLLSNQYLKGIVKCLDVKIQGKKGTMTVGIRKDVYGPVIQTPLSFKFPKKVNVTKISAFGMDGKIMQRESRLKSRTISHAAIPMGKAVHEGVQFKWKFTKAQMTVPDTCTFGVQITNTGNKPITDIALHAYVPTGLPIGMAGPKQVVYGKGMLVALKCDETSIAPGKSIVVKGKLQTQAESRFGLTPISLNMQAAVGGSKRIFLDGAEIPVMPVLGVDLQPRKQMPMRKGDVQYFQVRVSNAHKFLHGSKSQAKKGMVSLTPHPGLTIEPQSVPFQLKDSDAQTFIFKVTNAAWDKNKIRLRPVITLDGASTPISNLCVGTPIVRHQELIDVKPLDENGLLVYASYDDLTKNGSFDKSAGNPRPYHYPNFTTPYISDGVSKNCTSSSPSCNIYSPYRNIDHRAGTVMFWVKRDPVVKNELRYKGDPNTVPANLSEYVYEALFWTPGLQVYRYPDWSDKPGYVQVIYQEAFGDGKYGRRQVVNVPYNKEEQYEWMHWGVAWDIHKKQLDVFKNGKLVASVEKSQRPWYAFPWDNGGARRGWDLIINTQDHGRKCVTLRDEVYIYDRPLAAEQVLKHMKKARP